MCRAYVTERLDVFHSNVKDSNSFQQKEKKKKWEQFVTENASEDLKFVFRARFLFVSFESMIFVLAGRDGFPSHRRVTL